MSKGSIGITDARHFAHASELRPHIIDFLDHLRALGYSPLTVKHYRASATHFAVWLRCEGEGLKDVDAIALDRFVRHRCRCPGHVRDKRVAPNSSNRTRHFLQFLTDRGCVAASPPQGPAAQDDPRIVEFQDWSRRHRGIREATLNKRLRILTALIGALGDDPSSYDAALVQRVVLAEAKGRSPNHAKELTTALRCYLRFLGAQGQCSPSLHQAVPTFPHWRLATLPRYLPPAGVDRLLDACDITTPLGGRDRAVLLLLARLGLRAGDIFNLRLEDIDWANATIRVWGKGRREDRLPLPQDAGDALLAYITKVRPRTRECRVFLRVSAPYRPLSTSSAVSCLVRNLIIRAGIANPPSRGANLLRHTAATSLLRGGASLDAVGALLRHRSRETTAHYAKVDIPMLVQIAQPWPGGVSC